MSLIWQFFFREQGTINQLLAILLASSRVIWLSEPASAFGVIVLADSWYSYGFFMVAILGALTSISMELYEAAEVDGAGFWVQLRKITIPLIRPAILPAAVLTSITAFQQFGTPWAITQGGPVQAVGNPGATELVMVYAYKQVYQIAKLRHCDCLRCGRVHLPVGRHPVEPALYPHNERSVRIMNRKPKPAAMGCIYGHPGCQGYSSLSTRCGSPSWLPDAPATASTP